MVSDAGSVPGGGGELSPEGRNLLERELAEGERVVWSCHPTPGVYARGSWIVAVFGVVFMGFALVWFVMTGGGAVAAGSTGMPGASVFSIFPLCGLLPLAAGLVMLTAPAWMRSRAGRIVYAGPDRRALVVTPMAFGRLSSRSFSPVEVGSMERVERSDGSGDLVFAREVVNGTSDGPSQMRPVGFIGLADVRAAERVVRELADVRSGEDGV